MTNRGQYYKKIGVIYATSGIFPYNFDWGYTDSNVITSKKLYNIGHGCIWVRVNVGIQTIAYIF